MYCTELIEVENTLENWVCEAYLDRGQFFLETGGTLWSFEAFAK
jgi:hypothetical protein